MIFDLAAAKAHLRVDGNDEDELIVALCAAAEEQFNAYTGRILYAAGADLTDEPENALTVTESINIGAYVLIGYLYENREGGDGMPAPTKLLWNPYRWLAV